jgi:integrase
LDHFFVSNAKVRRYFEPPPGTDLDGREVIQRKGALKDGTPFFLGPDMRPVEPLCSFAFELAKSHRAKTLADYTYGLVDLVEFLAELDPPTDLLSATEDDLVAYREDRTQRQERPIAPATWRQRRTVINSFYDWAVEAGRLAKRPYYRRKSGRDALAWGATMDLDVRHLTYRQWRFLKQVGLRGLLPGDEVDRSFRGSSPLRNAAAAELAVTTGMRLQEWGSLLDLEVGPPRRDGLPVQVRLQATAKYGLPRDVTIQHATLRELDLYCRTERAAIVRTAARTLAGRRDELLVVTDIDLRQMTLRGRLNGRRRTFRVQAMPTPLRRLAVVEGDHGLEPLALFIGRGGLMLSKQRWEQVFSHALARAARIAAARKLELVLPARVRIHDLRHTFAIYMLQQLTQLVLEEEAERRRAGGHTAYLADHISRNPLLILQRLLGHRNPASTVTYLRYLRDTNALVAKAIAEWNQEDKTYADYAALLAAQRAG